MRAGESKARRPRRLRGRGQLKMSSSAPRRPYRSRAPWLICCAGPPKQGPPEPELEPEPDHGSEVGWTEPNELEPEPELEREPAQQPEPAPEPEPEPEGPEHKVLLRPHLPARAPHSLVCAPTPHALSADPPLSTPR
eukprot:COSAG04_NODE_34_length_34523_cov_40.302446_8_plen_137_part_00